jgi:hypothetical protein
MVFIPVPRTFEYVVETRCYENVAQNVFHTRPNDFPDTIPLADRVASVRAAWINRIMPKLTTEAYLYQVSGRDLSSEEGDSVAGATEQVVGGVVAEPAAPQVTALIQKITALGGRARRGRLYLSFLPETNIEGRTGSIPAAFLTPLQTQFNSFLSDLQAIGGTSDEQMVVVSRYLGTDAAGKPIPRAEGLVTPITSLLVSASVATQRERNRR